MDNINPLNYLDKDDIKPPITKSSVTKQCKHKYVLLSTNNSYNDLFYCKKCLNYEKRTRP